ncbi:hypothetical protein VTH06DRAFT_460 [Thermothelomyces fergusii]
MPVLPRLGLFGRDLVWFGWVCLGMVFGFQGLRFLVSFVFLWLGQGFRVVVICLRAFAGTRCCYPAVYIPSVESPADKL